MVRLSLGGNLKNSGREKIILKIKYSLSMAHKTTYPDFLGKGGPNMSDCGLFSWLVGIFQIVRMVMEWKLECRHCKITLFFRMQADLPRCGGQGQW
jgi:hypothetical protein